MLSRERLKGIYIDYDFPKLNEALDSLTAFKLNQPYTSVFDIMGRGSRNYCYPVNLSRKKIP